MSAPHSTKGFMGLTTCDCCGKQRADVRSMGRDANGDPDAPDMCFICIKEAQHGRVWSSKKEQYIPNWMFCIECELELDSYGACENRRCCEWRGLSTDHWMPVRHGYTVVSYRRL